MTVLFSELIGAALAILASTILQLIKYRFDELGERCDEIAAACLAAADLSTSYWMKDVEKRTLQLAVEEAVIVGHQERINGMVVAVLPRFTRATRRPVEERLVDLIDALTGGHFQEAPRSPDASRISQVQSAAAGLIVALRSAHGARLSLRGLAVLPDYSREEEDRWL